MRKAVAYYRVSTDQQGRSGLGLEAQQTAVTSFAGHSGYNILQEFTEVESGRKKNRPILQEALTFCKKQKAVLIIAKLDRLGRNVAFISALMESRAEFVAVDNPHANSLHLHIMAAFAEHERNQISIRTKEALQSAKRRGVKLGQHGRNVLSKQNKQEADIFAKQMRPIIDQLKQEGFTTYRAILAELNKREIPTARGTGYAWHFSSVQNLMNRLKEKH